MLYSFRNFYVTYWNYIHKRMHVLLKISFHFLVCFSLQYYPFYSHTGYYFS
jgi:hypothetical protein